MPQPYWREHLRFGNRYPLREAAANGQLVIVRCTCCRRTVHFVAADLAAILGPDRDARFPPFDCSTCRTAEYMTVTLRLPNPGDYGSLLVRRPGPVRRTQLWHDVRLGDEA